jgi:hypothetical protein
MHVWWLFSQAPPKLDVQNVWHIGLDACQSEMNKYVHNVLRGGIAPYPNGYSKRVNVSRLLSLEADVVRSTYAYVYAHIECAWSSNVFVFLSLHMHMFDYIKLQRKIHCHCIFSCFWDIFYSFFKEGSPLAMGINGTHKKILSVDVHWSVMTLGAKAFFIQGPIGLKTSLNFKNAPNPCWF